MGVHGSECEWTHVEHIENLVQVSGVFSDRSLNCPAMEIPLDEGTLGISLEECVNLFVCSSSGVGVSRNTRGECMYSLD